MTRIAARRLTYFMPIVLALTGAIAESPGAVEFSDPEPVEIIGYGGDAMEPFLSRDGKYLFFNNRNDPSVNTDLYWAEAIGDKRFRFMGEIRGVNTPALEGVPSMDREGNFYFISPRSYDRTLSTIYRGHFTDGQVTSVALVEGLAVERRGIVIFDAEISADGQMLYGAEGDLTGGPGAPKWSKIFAATREGDHFRRLPDSDRLFAEINRDTVQYAPDISTDGLTFYYTRLVGILFWRSVQIMVATRPSPTAPFGPPHPVAAVTGFAEGPSISNNGDALYFHKLVDGGYRVYRATRQR